MLLLISLIVSALFFKLALGFYEAPPDQWSEKRKQKWYQDQVIFTILGAGVIYLIGYFVI
jgi:hypothetical protein